MTPDQRIHSSLERICEAAGVSIGHCTEQQLSAMREENERQRFDILAMNQSLDLLRQENERLRVQLAGCGVARSTDRNARLVNQCRDHDTRRAAAVAQCAAMAEEIERLNETITALTRESRDAQEM